MDLKKKGFGSAVFYIFLILFIVIAYLYNNGTLTSLFPKNKISLPDEKRNVIELEFKEKSFDINYPNTYTGSALALANFEEGEKWVGDFNIDDTNFIEGKSGVSVIAKNNVSNIISLKENLDLSKFDVFKILVYAAKDDVGDNIRKLNLRFGNSNDSQYFEYSIRNIKTGWNLITMEKGNFAFNQEKSNDNLWRDIEKVSLELNARPTSRVELTFDRLWTEQDATFQEEFRAVDLNGISLKNYNRQIYLNIWPMGSNLILLKKITAVKNFTYTVKAIPQRTGSFGINARTDISNGYGYYFDLNGIGSGGWQLNKIGKPVEGIGSQIRLDNGEIANFLLEENKPIWLRLKLSGSTITAYISINGKDFTTIAEKIDPELKAGSIGFHTGGGSYLVESVDFTQ